MSNHARPQRGPLFRECPSRSFFRESQDKHSVDVPVSNVIVSRCESNPLRRVYHLRAGTLGHDNIVLAGGEGRALGLKTEFGCR